MERRTHLPRATPLVSGVTGFEPRQPGCAVNMARCLSAAVAVATGACGCPAGLPPLHRVCRPPPPGSAEARNAGGGGLGGGAGGPPIPSRSPSLPGQSWGAP